MIRCTRSRLRRRLGDRERAADLAQDTFVRLIASTVAHPLREPRNFLATVAKRVMVDHLRRRSLEQAYLEALALEPELVEVSAEHTVNVNNLFDEKYYAGMAGSYAHYGAPRNTMLNLRYDF